LKPPKADVLADHIVVLYRGHLVCQGSSTTLKGQHGDGYRVASIDSLEGNTLGWKFDTSIEATRKVIELESANEVCDVIYPTLEQVFLKVTSDSDSARHIGGDGLIGDEEAQTATNNKSDFLEEDTEDSSELNLDVARSIGMVRQVWVLFRKRYMLLRSSWFAYLV
jgi:ATP-binding cassette subfamily A (ABC1) protein 3